MPEIADLEAVRHYLEPRLRGLTVARAEAPLPWLVRTGAQHLADLAGRRLGPADRRGKFLMFAVDDGRVLVVNPMLTGRFHWVEAGAKRIARTAVVLGFDDGHELRYSDERRMGRWYLVERDALDGVPQMAALGPDALAIEEDEFVERFRKRRGQIKNALTNQEVLAGIGNAYADEILWAAQLHPHRRGATMTDDDRRRLFRAMRETIAEATAIVEAAAQAEGLGTKEEWRQHLKVHRRSGQPCPRCGQTVRGQARGDSETSYCLRCQPLFE